MILKETQQILHIGIYEIVSQVVVNTIHTTILRLIVKHVAGHTHQCEIHNRLEVCISLIERAILLPPRGTDSVLGPHLAHNIKLRVLSHNLQIPLAHHIIIGIGICILTNSIDTRILNPPDGILNQVASDVRISLIYINVETRILHHIRIILRCIGIIEYRLLMISLTRGTLVDPILCWGIQHPGVVGANVVEDNIHHHAQTLLMSLLNQTTVILIAAQTTVHLIHIGREVAVVRSATSIILQHGVEPDCRNSQIHKVIQMILNTLQVATVTRQKYRAIDFIFGTHRHLIVRGVAIGKAVGHHQVEYIRRVITLNIIGRRTTLLKLIGISKRLLPIAERDVKHTRLCILHIEVDDHIVRALESVDALNLNIFILNRGTV